MKLLPILILTLLLSACTPQAPKAIDPNQIYQGYPCGDSCADFEAGFLAAQKGQYRSELDCASLPLKQATGCQVFVLEKQRSSPTFSDLNIE